MVRIGEERVSGGGTSYSVHMNEERPAEEIPVDAYTGYIIRLSEARTSELRREAAEYALSRVSRGDDTSLRARIVSWLGRRPQGAVEPTTTAVAPPALRSVPSRPTA